MTSEAQKKASAKYKEKNKGKFVEMRYKVSVKEREIIKSYCDKKDISVSDFTKKLVFDEINKNS